MLHFFKKQQPTYFNNLYIPAIALFFLFFLHQGGIFKALCVLAIPVITFPMFWKELSNHIKIGKKEKIWIVVVVGIFEILFTATLFFIGIPTIPYLPAPLNNLLFLGIVCSLLCFYFLKKEKLSKKHSLYIMICIWSLILLYPIIQEVV